jgi:hypothetical protein
VSVQSWTERWITGVTDGPTLTAAARASCIPTAERKVLPVTFGITKAIRISMGGRISCVVTTPGTARFDICLGAAGTTIVYDTGALNLNTTAQTTVPWYFEVELVCRAVGTSTSTTFFPHGGRFVSEAVVGSAADTAGGNGYLNAPTGTPAVGAGTDSTAVHILDCFFTQTVATGSLIVHTFNVDLIN